MIFWFLLVILRNINFLKFFLRVYDIIGYSVDEFNDVILYKYVYLEDFVMFVVCYKICKFILWRFYI